VSEQTQPSGRDKVSGWWLAGFIQRGQKNISICWRFAGDFRKVPGWPRKNWRGVVEQDLWRMELSWKEARIGVVRGCS